MFQYVYNGSECMWECWVGDTYLFGATEQSVIEYRDELLTCATEKDAFRLLCAEYVWQEMEKRTNQMAIKALLLWLMEG